MFSSTLLCTKTQRTDWSKVHSIKTLTEQLTDWFFSSFVFGQFSYRRSRMQTRISRSVIQYESRFTLRTCDRFSTVSPSVILIHCHRVAIHDSWRETANGAKLDGNLSFNYEVQMVFRCCILGRQDFGWCLICINVVNITEWTTQRLPRQRKFISPLSLSGRFWCPSGHYPCGHHLLTLMTSNTFYQIEFSHSTSWQFAVECIRLNFGRNCFLPSVLYTSFVIRSNMCLFSLLLSFCVQRLLSENSAKYFKRIALELSINFDRTFHEGEHRFV